MRIEEIKNKNNDELNKEISSLKEELFNLRFQQAVGQLQNPARMKQVKKTIARIKTVINERRLAEVK
jgi:large subunit ribosomal protein L29